LSAGQRENTTDELGERVIVSELELMEKAQAELSPARFEHTKGVVEAAERLARRFGVDVTKARVAAWIHDIAREWPQERLAQVAEQVEIPAGFALIPAILHGPIAAHLAAEWFDIDDENIQNAVRYHTTGRVGMSDLEKVLFLADAIERGRNYPGVEKIRALAEQDLNLALAESFDNTILYLVQTHQPIFPLTVMARNELWEQVTATQASETHQLNHE
jgi:predicted HD superfamily hydrolase involved in NAD metabolism